MSHLIQQALQEVARRRELAAKATPGPWRVARNQMGHITFIIAPDDQAGAIGEVYGQDAKATADARLIADARNHAEATLDLMEALLKRLGRNVSDWKALGHPDSDFWAFNPEIRCALTAFTSTERTPDGNCVRCYNAKSATYEAVTYFKGPNKTGVKASDRCLYCAWAFADQYKVRMPA